MDRVSYRPVAQSLLQGGVAAAAILKRWMRASPYRDASTLAGGDTTDRDGGRWRFPLPRGRRSAVFPEQAADPGSSAAQRYALRPPGRGVSAAGSDARDRPRLRRKRASLLSR